MAHLVDIAVEVKWDHAYKVLSTELDSEWAFKKMVSYYGLSLTGNRELLSNHKQICTVRK